MRSPTLFEIRVALETALFAAVQSYFDAGDIIVIQPGGELKPDLDKIQIIHSVNPGVVQDGELGGRQGLCPRDGVYVVTLSCPNNTDRLAQTWELSSIVESKFYRADLPITDADCFVMCDEPYTTNVGETDDKRLALSVSITWWVWAGGYDEGE